MGTPRSVFSPSFRPQVVPTPTMTTPKSAGLASSSEPRRSFPSSNARRRSSVPPRSGSRRSTPAPRSSSSSARPDKRRRVGSTPRSSSRAPPSTPSTHSPTTRFSVAVVEFRSRQEVGIAAIDLLHMVLELYEFRDNQTYSNTVGLLTKYDPENIMIPETTASSALARILAEEFPLTSMLKYRRKYFNDNDGLAYISEHGVPGSAANLDPQQYLCLSAASCLMKWVEYSQKVSLATKSLKVEYKNLAGYMMLDRATTTNLSLVPLQGARSGGGRGSSRVAGSLFDVLNRCSTSLGVRLLRQNLLQPLTDLPSIELRQQAVVELLENESVYWELVGLLPLCARFDSVNATLVKLPNNAASDAAQERTISNLMELKGIISALPQISASVLKCENQLCRLIGDNLSNSSADVLAAVIDAVIDPSVSFSHKAEPATARTNLLFAVKGGVSGRLDLSRSTFKEALEDIDNEFNQLREAYAMDKMRLVFTKSRGYHLRVPREQLEMDGVPAALFVRRSSRGRSVDCSTEALEALNRRQDEAYSDVLQMTHDTIQDVLRQVRAHMPWLHHSAESISLLDLLHSFASYATTCGVGLARCVPRVLEDGPLAIQKGFHPILAVSLQPGECIPNNTFIDQASRLQIITGPNSSGKSVYLNQLALLTVIAHIGCHVPAEFASFPCVRQICTRMTMGDDMESNAGTFLREMRETSYILHSATDSSLVLIDELGRGTSVSDGVGLAWAVCESLLDKGSLTLCATHFQELTEMSALYEAAKNINLSVHAAAHADGSAAMQCTYQVTAGASPVLRERYGIQIAQLVFPQAVVEGANRVRDELQQGRALRLGATPAPSTRVFHTVCARLLSLQHSNLPRQELVRWLKKLQRQMKKAMGKKV